MLSEASQTTTPSSIHKLWLVIDRQSTRQTGTSAKSIVRRGGRSHSWGNLAGVTCIVA